MTQILTKLINSIGTNRRNDLIIPPGPGVGKYLPKLLVSNS